MLPTGRDAVLMTNWASETLRTLATTPKYTSAMSVGEIPTMSLSFPPPPRRPERTWAAAASEVFAVGDAGAGRPPT